MKIKFKDSPLNSIDPNLCEMGTDLCPNYMTSIHAARHAWGWDIDQAHPAKLF